MKGGTLRRSSRRSRLFPPGARAREENDNSVRSGGRCRRSRHSFLDDLLSHSADCIHECVFVLEKVVTRREKKKKKGNKRKRERSWTLFEKHVYRSRRDGGRTGDDGEGRAYACVDIRAKCMQDRVTQCIYYDNEIRFRGHPPGFDATRVLTRRSLATVSHWKSVEGRSVREQAFMGTPSASD